MANAANTLYDALGNLNNSQRQLVEATLSDGKLIFGRISSDGVRGIEETIYELTLLLCLLTGKSHSTLALAIPPITLARQKIRVGEELVCSEFRLGSPYCHNYCGWRAHAREKHQKG